MALNEKYTIMIAWDWNVPTSGVCYVTRFEVDQEFASTYPVRQVGWPSSNCGGGRRA
jgi:hypothetical protein